MNATRSDVDELRTLTNDALKISAKMLAHVDNISFNSVTTYDGAKALDLCARELQAVADNIKDASYRLRGAK
jgi:hypothetical protein